MEDDAWRKFDNREKNRRKDKKSSQRRALPDSRKILKKKRRGEKELIRLNINKRFWICWRVAGSLVPEGGNEGSEQKWKDRVEDFCGALKRGPRGENSGATPRQEAVERPKTVLGNFRGEQFEAGRS